MKALLPVALLMGSLLAPSIANAWEYMNRDESHKQCMYFHIRRRVPDKSDWNKQDRMDKAFVLAGAHKMCKG